MSSETWDPGAAGLTLSVPRSTGPAPGGQGSLAAPGADAGQAADPFERPLPEPAAPVTSVAFDSRDLGGLRAVVGHLAASAGLSQRAADDLVLAVHEVASNSVIHGGGAGVLRWWLEPRAVVVEVRDLGRIHDPTVGRTPPPAHTPGGRGLWLVTRLCETVQIRSGDWGTTVRIRHDR